MATTCTARKFQTEDRVVDPRDGLAGTVVDLVDPDTTGLPNSVCVRFDDAPDEVVEMFEHELEPA
jgi:hypothetical protein